MANEHPNRNLDGSYKHVHAPTRATPRHIIARWVEAEVFALKKLGLSYPKIANSIGRAGRREIAPAVPLPDVEFPGGYSIDARSVRRTFDKAIGAAASLALASYRKLDNERAEDLYLAAQPGVAAGNPEAIRTAVRVLDHIAKINGYSAEAEAAMKARKAKADAEAPEGDGDEDAAFQTAVMRALTNDERQTLIDIIERGKKRVREAEAGRTPIETTRIPVASDAANADRMV